MKNFIDGFRRAVSQERHAWYLRMKCFVVPERNGTDKLFAANNKEMKRSLRWRRFSKDNRTRQTIFTVPSSQSTSATINNTLLIDPTLGNRAMRRHSAGNFNWNFDQKTSLSYRKFPPENHPASLEALPGREVGYLLRFTNCDVTIKC